MQTLNPVRFALGRKEFGRIYFSNIDYIHFDQNTAMHK